MFAQIIRTLGTVLLCLMCTAPALAENLLPTTSWVLEGQEEGVRSDDYLFLLVRPSRNDSDAINLNAPNAGKRSYDFTLEPAMPGTWLWLGQGSLEFQPAQAWQPDTRYTITASPTALPAGMEFSPNTFSFTTSPLLTDVFSANFFFDPQNVQKKVINLEASFTYPVNPNSVAQAFQVKPEQGLLLGTPEFSWNQENTRMVCTIPVLELPETSKTVDLALTNAYRDESSGTAGLPTEIQVIVTGRNDLFTLNSVLSGSATHSSMAGEQLLSFEFSLPCTPAELLSKVKVFLLPRQRIADAVDADKKAPYTWWTTTELTPDVLARAEELPLALTTDPQLSSAMISFSYRAEPGRGLYIVVEPHIFSSLNFESAQGLKTIITVPPYENALTLMQNGGVLTLNGDKKLAVYSRNLDSISYSLSQIRPEAINILLASSYGTDSALLYSYADQDTMSVVYEGHIKLNKSDPLAPQFSSIDLGPALAGKAIAPPADPAEKLNLVVHPGALQTDQLPQAINGPGRGLFSLNMWGHRLNAAGQKESVAMDNSGPPRFILVTDLGIIHKLGANGSTAYVVSLAEGKPAADVTVSVLGTNGLSVFSGQTDAEGSLQIPDLTALHAEKKPLALVAQRGDDIAFLPLKQWERKLNYSRFDVGGQQSTGDLNAFVFTQRDLYKPGETLHFGYMVKQQNWAELAGLPLEVVLSDPRGNELKRTVHVNADGFGEISFDLPESAPTGSYYFALCLVNPAESQTITLDSTRVRVEEFEPDTQRISARLEPQPGKGWLKPEGLRLEATLSNLFGTPAPDRRMVVTMLVNPSHFSFKEYPDWSFYDPYYALGRQQRQKLPEQHTNEQGEAVFSIPMSQYADTTYHLGLVTQGFDPASGKAVSCIVQALVSPLDALMGWKSDANLNFVRQGEQATVELLWVNNKLEAQNSGPLTLETLRSQSVKTLVRSDNGAYSYRNQPQEKLISSTEIEVPATGLSLNLDSSEPGDKVLLVRDSKGQVISRIEYSVAGNAAAQLEIDKQPGLNIRLNKSDFNPGETIEVALSMPYSGAGLITLERDQVYSHVWFQAEAGETTQRLTIPANFEGRGFVNATVFRGMNDADIFSEPVSSAVAPFTSNMAARNMNLKVEAPEMVRPGQVFNVSVQAEKPGKVLVFAVDEGILQMSSFENPNPLKALLGNRALQVSTSQYFDLLMPQYSLLSQAMKFGGGDFASASMGQNPFHRRSEESAVFWSGILDLDSGKAMNVPITMPATFSGELRVIAVSCSQSAVGAASTRSLVQAEVVMLPAMPLFVAPGDSFEAAVTLTDMSGENRTVRLELLTEAGLRVSSEKLPVLDLEYGREQSVRVRMVATDVLGPTTVTLRAVPVADSTGKSPANTTVVERPVQLSVRPVMPHSVALRMGKAENVADINLNRELYPQMATVEASVSALPLPMAYAFMHSLNLYPLGCTEQVVSAAFPALVLLQNPALSPQGADFTPQALQERVTKAVETLSARQDYKGSFALWPNGDSDYTGFVQVYATDFLTTAQAMGLAVPSRLLKNALDSVENVCSTVPYNLEQARIQAYGAWVLTRNGRISSNILATLTSWLEQNQTNWQQDIVAPLMAVCWEMMMQSQQADQLLTAYQAGLTANPKAQLSHSPWFSTTANLSLYLTLLDQSFPEQKTAPSSVAALDTLVDIIQNSLVARSTLSEALASRALLQWAANGGATIDTATLEAFDKDHKPLPLALEQSAVAFGGSLSGEQAASLANLRLSAPGTFYWQVSSSGFATHAPTKPVEHGLAVTKYILTAEGKPLGAPMQAPQSTPAVGNNPSAVNSNPKPVGNTPTAGATPLKKAAPGKAQPALPELPILPELPAGPVVVEQGDELIMVIRAQSYGQTVEQVAITDLLPGGFEMVLGASGVLQEAEVPLNFQTRGDRPMDVTTIDRREDRITIISTLYPVPSVFAYKVRAVTKGDFALPPVQAECMYDSLRYATDALNTLKVD